MSLKSAAAWWWVLCLGLLLPAAGSAQRALSIESYAVPADGAVALTVAQGLPLSGAYAAVNERSAGALQRALSTAGFMGERGTVLSLPGIAPYAQVVVIGIGAEAESERLLEDIGGLAGQAGVLSAAERLELLWPEGKLASAGAHLAFGAALGQYTFRQYKNQKPEAPVLGKGRLIVRVSNVEAARSAWSQRWQPLAEGVGFARNLVTEPGNVIYPESFVARVEEAFQPHRNVRIEVLDVPRMRELGMGAMLAVGEGSVRPPRLLVVRYRGAGDDSAPLALVGKGITFDSGGISIKPAENMWRMKYDMSGAAAVMGATLALAERGAKANVTAVAALAPRAPVMWCALPAGRLSN